ncbi:MAG TPA: MFS transporter [Anaerolineae bacterium]|nr:MFS transporter [Anaerolineae bacterium]HNU05346.1 MFS transporter [Anaerolineae bacterium]
MSEATLRARLRTVRASYPPAFWVLFWGLLINSAGSSMVWPFLTIFIRQRLEVSLTTVTLLFSLNSFAGLIALSFVGPAVDRFGRRFAMITGLIAGGLILVTMSLATTLPLWVAVMAAQGVFSPFYRVGSDAMIADMIEPGRRAGAYALLRMINNLGIAVGPAIGGFVAGVSYTLAFYIAAAASLLFVSMILFKVPETLPTETETVRRGGGYGPVLRDRSFLAFCGVFVLVTIPAAILMVLLAVYAKENFGVVEQQYGFIMATNATLVVLLQYRVTRTSQRYSNWRVLALGALFYAVGAGSVALGQGFWAFWLSMVILTFGELLLAPTGSAMAADLAPVDMRGRYMGLYGLTWGISFGLGPVIAGALNDNLAPVAMWVFAGAAGLVAAAGFALLGRRVARRSAAQR